MHGRVGRRSRRVARTMRVRRAWEDDTYENPFGAEVDEGILDGCGPTAVKAPGDGPQ